MIKKILTSLFALLLIIGAKAGNVDTLKVHSASMNKDIKVVAITPDNMKQPLPVLYLLHGYSGNHGDWIKQKPELQSFVDKYNYIIICPDGANSWYFDSPVKANYKYETFISKELVEYVDTKYKTINAREGRAITGLSMGGHGAMWISLRHSDVFGAAGSIAGGVDFRPFPFNWEIKDLLGSEADNQLVWDSHTAISQICRVKNGRLALIIDCGYSDFFFEVNNLFHQELLKYKINHDFIVREGGHNWAYFTKSIDYQLLFFSNFFYNKKEDKK